MESPQEKLQISYGYRDQLKDIEMLAHTTISKG